jgi:DNA-directed RNA polymerase specialized sigma24 family protein
VQKFSWSQNPVALRELARHADGRLRSRYCLAVLDAHPEWLDRLPESEQRLLRDHCLRGRSLSQIAGELGVAQTYVTQMHKRASRNLAVLLMADFRADQRRQVA